MRSRAARRRRAAAAHARAPSNRKAPERLRAARPPVATGLTADENWTPRASQPKAAPRLSLGTRWPPSEYARVRAPPREKPTRQRRTRSQTQELVHAMSAQGTAPVMEAMR